MDRRGFIKGVFGGVAATGLIVQATPSEIEAFASVTKIGEQVNANKLAHPEAKAGWGEIVFNSKGEAIGVIDSVNVRSDDVEITSVGDSQRKFMPGMTRLEYRVVASGMGPVYFGNHWVKL